MENESILTEAGYLAALREVSALIDLDPSFDSQDGKRLAVVGQLVQAYEADHISWLEDKVSASRAGLEDGTNARIAPQEWQYLRGQLVDALPQDILNSMLLALDRPVDLTSDIEGSVDLS